MSVLVLAAAALGGCAFNCADKKSVAYFPNDSFEPAKVLLDESGRVVNAHGAGFLYDGGRYYMFGEHKLGGELGNKALVGVHCYSSADLLNWRDEGIALPMSEDPNSPIIKGTILERPKVVYNAATKKYVMFFHLEKRSGPTAKSTNIDDILAEKSDYSAAMLGTAVSDKPEGPYNFLSAGRINAGKYPAGREAHFKAVRAELDAKYPNWKTAPHRKRKGENPALDGQIFLRDFDGGQMSRDFTVFVDDDKTAYVFTASEDNLTLHIHELDASYTGFTGKFARALIGGENEAPAVFKKGGKYFMFSSHCTGWAPNAGRISTADSPLGEWRELGNPCRGDGREETLFAPEAKADTTFRSQSTYVISVIGKKDAFIYVGDRWMPQDAIDGRYVFLPVEWENSTPVIRWRDSWELSLFDAVK